MENIQLVLENTENGFFKLIRPKIKKLETLASEGDIVDIKFISGEDINLKGFMVYVDDSYLYSFIGRRGKKIFNYIFSKRGSSIEEDKLTEKVEMLAALQKEEGDEEYEYFNKMLRKAGL